VEAARARHFTDHRGLAVLRHKGAADQALVRLIWPTTDNSDPELTMTLNLLAQVAGVEVTDSVREKLGKAYSPGASSDQDQFYKGWGTFTLQAGVDVADVAATRAALARTAAGLLARPVSADIFTRARAPMLERLDNALKSNAGWLALTERAQSKPDRIARFQAARARLMALTPADIQAAARRFLDPGRAVTVLVLPEGPRPPKHENRKHEDR
jgi:zinc protease